MTSLKSTGFWPFASTIPLFIFQLMVFAAGLLFRPQAYGDETPRRPVPLPEYDWKTDLQNLEDILEDPRMIRAKKLNYVEEKLFWLLDRRNAWSERIANSGRRLDAYFAGQQSQNYSNASFLRVRFGPTLGKAGQLSAEPDLKLRLNLPLTKDKYRLVLESDSNDTKSLREKSAENILGEGNTNTENFTGALRYMSPMTAGWKLTTDFGIKFRWPPDPFVRTKAENSWQLDDNWRSEVLSSIYWFQSEQLGANFIANFDRKLTEKLFFRNTSETHWIEDEDKFEFGNIINLYQTYSATEVLRYRAAYFAESRPNPRTFEYYIDVTYRKRVYRDWLFYEIIPALKFPRADSFKDNPSITFKLEVMFAQD